MVFIINQPLFVGDLKKIPETKNNSRFYILKFFLTVKSKLNLIHDNTFYYIYYVVPGTGKV